MFNKRELGLIHTALGYMKSHLAEMAIVGDEQWKVVHELYNLRKRVLEEYEKEK